MVEVVIVTTVMERRVTWTPKGWNSPSTKTAVIRDGKLKGNIVMESYFLEADSDGAVEFLQEIKRAITETKKKGGD